MTARLYPVVAVLAAACFVAGCSHAPPPTKPVSLSPPEQAKVANQVFLSQKTFDPWVLTTTDPNRAIHAYLCDGNSGNLISPNGKIVTALAAGHYNNGQLQAGGLPVDFPPYTVPSDNNLRQELNLKTGTLYTSLFQRQANGVPVLRVIASRPQVLTTGPRTNWPKLWAASDVQIDGDPEAQQVTHANLFYLLSSTYPGSRHSLPPMGLSSTVYGGHIFWDADVWMLPALVVQHPEYAKSIIDYRFDRLAQAKRNAKAHRFAGAEFPWESADTGAEVAPAEFAQERHITADVAWAAWQYYLWTADKKYLQTEGWPLLQACADYWVGRVTKGSPPGPPSLGGGNTKAQGVSHAAPQGAGEARHGSQNFLPPELGGRGGLSFHIFHILGPDETAGPVDDDAYTVGVVRESLDAAVQCAHILGKMPNPAWRRVHDGLSVPFDKQRGIPQQSAAPMGERFAGKQADALLLLHPLHAAYDTATQGRMLDFYSAHTIKNGPAMTDSIHAIVAARLGRDAQALAFFQGSYRPFERGPWDAFSEKRTTNNVYFLTGMAGCVQSVLYGFAGLNIAQAGLTGRGQRLTGDSVASLYASPHLPPGWTGLTVRGIRFRGRTLTLTVGAGNRVTVK